MRRLALALLGVLALAAAGVAWAQGGVSITNVGRGALLYAAEYETSGESLITDRNGPLRIGTATMTLYACYESSGASASAWAPCGGITAAGSTLSKVEDGADFSLNAKTPFLDGTSAVDFDGTIAGGAGDYFESGDAGYGDLTTEDLAIELIFAPENAGGAGVFGQIIGQGVIGTDGWRVASNSANINLQLRASTVGVTSTIAVAANSTWMHAFFLVDRDLNASTGMRAWLNGVVTDNDNPSTASGSLVNTAVFAVGAAAASAGVGSINSNSRVASVRVWKCAGCLDLSDPGAEDAVVLRRSLQLWGVWPTSAVEPLPSVYARTSSSMSHKYTDPVTELYAISTGALHIDSRSNGTGLIIEGSTTNLLIRNEDYSTGWTLLDIGDTWSLNGTADPVDDEISAADGLIADATDGQHGVTQAASLTAVMYVFSVYAKAGTQGWLYISDDTVASATGYANLATCAAGTKGVGAAEILTANLGNGWCRVGISFTGTAASHTHRIGCAPADADNTFAGDGASVACWLYAAQSEAQSGFWSSPIMTAASTALRAADDLRIATDNIRTQRGSIVADVTIHNHETTNGSSLGILGSASGTTHWALLLLSGNNDRASCSMRQATATTATVDGTVDVSDGVRRVLACGWATDSVTLYDDGAVDGTPDTQAGAPLATTTVAIGTLGYSPPTGASVPVIFHGIKTFAREGFSQ